MSLSIVIITNCITVTLHTDSIHSNSLSVNKMLNVKFKIRSISLCRLLASITLRRHLTHLHVILVSVPLHSFSLWACRQINKHFI